MALLERVALLLSANLNDIVERAENPLKMMNQVILDMENQSLQVKTQVAIAVADRHLLERKREESLASEKDWMKKAAAALERQDDETARAALQRSLSSRDIANGFEEQLIDQKAQVENLKSALHKLNLKLADARGQADLLKTRRYRARAVEEAPAAPADIDKQDEIERLLADLKAKRI